MNSKQQKIIQARLSGYNDCYLHIHETLKEMIANPILPQPVSEFMRGFLDGMERDQEKLCKAYIETQISALRKIN